MLTKLIFSHHSMQKSCGLRRILFWAHFPMKRSLTCGWKDSDSSNSLPSKQYPRNVLQFCQLCSLRTPRCGGMFKQAPQYKQWDPHVRKLRLIYSLVTHVLTTAQKETQD